MNSAFKKTLGIFCLLVVVITITAVREPGFRSAGNVVNTIRWSSLFGVIAIGAALVIITGGIDLSIGSLIGLIGCLFPFLLIHRQWPMWQALPAVLALSVLIGLIHGLLITKLRLQAFIVTLCGLLAYRSIARIFTDDTTQGYGIGFVKLKVMINGTLIESLTGKARALDLPNVAILFLAISLLAAFFLNRMIWGRYLFALGRNEQAARFSGIRTDRIIILTYVICSLLAGVAGILFSVFINSAGPSNFGAVYELYAIAAAVLGGCSLRGGEGSILGVVIGTVLIVVVRNSAVMMVSNGDRFEYLVLALVILCAVMVDEIIRRLAESRAQRQKLHQAAARPAIAKSA